MTKKIDIPTIGISEICDYIPDIKEETKILEFEEQAEKDIQAKKQIGNVHFRWSEFEIARAKKIAEKLGLPYQTYIKSLIKQGMDKDEQQLKEM